MELSDPNSTHFFQPYSQCITQCRKRRQTSACDSFCNLFAVTFSIFHTFFERIQRLHYQWGGHYGASSVRSGTKTKQSMCVATYFPQITLFYAQTFSFLDSFEDQLCTLGMLYIFYGNMCIATILPASLDYYMRAFTLFLLVVTEAKLTMSVAKSCQCCSTPYV